MKKETIKYIIQLVIAILTAIGTTLGVTSCMRKKAPQPPKGEYVKTHDYYELSNPENLDLYDE